ncbi:MAG: FAD-binding oxidoreductase [Minisyncoccia bacterium]
MSLREEIASLIKGDVADDAETLKRFSRDTSVFERRPALVISPKDADDVAKIISYASSEKKKGANIAIAARSAGTDMTGGPLTDSLVLSFTKHLNKVHEVGSDYVVAEPGVYYRDLEKQTLGKAGTLIPSYPASREICALGGMIANNSGGELTLHYGKTERYVEELDVVLADGSKTTFKPLTQTELAKKEAEKTFEGEIYRKIHDLIMDNRGAIEAARPNVSKNSAGYALWDVWNEEKGTFDLTKLIVGSQGTLGIVTKARLKTVKLKPHRAMLVVFLSEISHLPEVVKRILKCDPESFESYDEHTFSFAVRFMPQMLKQMGLWQAIKLGFAFLPEVGMVLTGGVPKFLLMAEFAEDTKEAAQDRVREARHTIDNLPVHTKLIFSNLGREKYWKVRRESFNLLRKSLPGLSAAPFIDDLVVKPETYPEFLPELNELLSHYKFTFTVAGHIGNGNFHILPLMDLTSEESHRVILELTPKVYDLVAKYKGSTTGEHNDGIIRTPYLNTMFSHEVLALFAEVKKIFDPLNILNPGKKVGGTEADIAKYMITKK